MCTPSCPCESVDTIGTCQNKTSLHDPHRCTSSAFVIPSIRLDEGKKQQQNVVERGVKQVTCQLFIHIMVMTSSNNPSFSHRLLQASAIISAPNTIRHPLYLNSELQTGLLP
jgi:hypothetical protein